MNCRILISAMIVPAMLGACSDAGNAQSGEAPAVAAAPSAAPSAMTPEDVTAAGFPFVPGRYIRGEDCEAGEPDFAMVDFTPEYSHEYEADADVLFGKIVKIGEGHYRITEQWPDFETDGTYPIEAEYIAAGEGRFQRTTTEDGETQTENYKYCAPDTAIGQYGQY